MSEPLSIKKTHAHKYIGIGRQLFEKHILPMVSVYKMGGLILIDRLELISAWEQYKSGCAGRPQEEGKKCQKDTGSTIAVSTKSTNVTSASAFQERLAMAKAKNSKSKQKYASE